MLDMTDIGNFKIQYPNHKQVRFENLDFYWTLAKKNISKFADTICAGHSREMLANDDVIANIANAIMMADWRWDANRTGATGESKTKYSYRNQCAIWAIKSHISRKCRKQKKKNPKIYSVDSGPQEDLCIMNILENNKLSDPSDIVSHNEEQQNLTDDIHQLINSDIISDKQKQYITMYFFEDLTLDQIGKKFGVTREAVRQSLNRAYKAIREVMHD